MALSSADLLLWTPRLLGILVSLFIGMFALDAFSQGKPFLHALLDFSIHLVPALVLLTLVAVSFRWEWIGAVVFIGIAIVYATTMSRGAPRLDAPDLGAAGRRRRALLVELAQPRQAARIVTQDI